MWLVLLIILQVFPGVTDIKQHGGGPADCGSGSGRGVLVSAVQLYVLSGVEDEESGGVSHQQPVAV